MRTVHIVASCYVDEYMEARVGGIESYIQLLVRALLGSWKVVVYQPSTVPFRNVVAGVDVVGLGRVKLKQIVRGIMEGGDSIKIGDVLLFSTDQYCCPTAWGSSAVIQHGVSWDLPTRYLTKRSLAHFFERAYRVFLSWNNHRRVRTFKNVICVDYNYINWYSTLATESERAKQFVVIPNCAGSQFFCKSKPPAEGSINILFARRFVGLRGVDLFLEVTRELLSRFKDISITFAGDGEPSEVAKIERFSSFDNRVSILKASYKDMPSIYENADIVVIPSLASEGTSLCAMEAMAMGKCVVASSVGGLTNIIIDEYNGFLVAPTAQAFFRRIVSLVDDPAMIRKTGDNAKQIADVVFNFETWAKRWRDVLEEIAR